METLQALPVADADQGDAQRLAVGVEPGLLLQGEGARGLIQDYNAKVNRGHWFGSLINISKLSDFSFKS